MSNVARRLSREFFQLNGFFVGGGHPFFVLKPSPRHSLRHSTEAKVAPPFILDRKNIISISTAAVTVRTWHTEQLFPSVIINNPDAYSFEDSSAEEARKFFPEGDLRKILIISRFPKNRQVREKSIALLSKRGIDNAIEFETILTYLTGYMKTNINYTENDMLQLIRLLKCYGLLRGPQLELFR